MDKSIKEFEDWYSDWVKTVVRSSRQDFAREVYAACQSLNDKRIEQLMAVITKKDEALAAIAEYQIFEVEMAETAQEALAIKPENVELVEVGEVEHELDHDGMSRGQFGSLAQSWIIPMYTKLYTIKHK